MAAGPRRRHLPSPLHTRDQRTDGLARGLGHLVPLAKRPSDGSPLRLVAITRTRDATLEPAFRLNRGWLFHAGRGSQRRRQRWSSAHSRLPPLQRRGQGAARAATRTRVSVLRTARTGSPPSYRPSRPRRSSVAMWPVGSESAGPARDRTERTSGSRSGSAPFRAARPAASTTRLRGPTERRSTTRSHQACPPGRPERLQYWKWPDGAVGGASLSMTGRWARPCISREAMVRGGRWRPPRRGEQDPSSATASAIDLGRSP